MSLGPHEQQLRALREKKAARAARRPTTPPAAPAYKEPVMKTDQPTNISMAEMRGDDLRKAPAKIKPPKKAAKKAPKKAAKKAKKKAAKAETLRAGLRPGSKLAIIDGMLRRPGGCTRKEAMAAAGWPSISMQQQATALNAFLKSEKKDGVTRYWIE